MPVLDGHDATRRIRHELGLTDLPIIALTAGALSSERQRAADAGMDYFIIKPFSAEALVRSIVRHVKPPSTGHGQPARLTDGAPEMPVHVARPWPEIEGIDSADARARLGDDLGLFGVMLTRLLHEFSDVALPTATTDRGALASHAARMHKLRGSAGMLGAKAIHNLAGETEVACAAGEGERAAHLAANLAAQLQRLLQSATPALHAVQVRIDETAPPSSSEIDPRLLVDLVDLLRRQNLAAVDRFTAITPQLQRSLGQESYELVRAHMNNLQFNEAASILERGQPGGNPSSAFASANPRP
jgi:CheY-like chemotaxis protein